MTRKAKSSTTSSLKIEIPEGDTLKPRIVIFGVGGAGGNAINNMIRSNLEGVEFVAANTDSQALKQALAENKIQLGVKITKGLGAGSFPDRGRAAAEENLEEIANLLEGANMVFIAAGMGGGTGTGAAPVIAKLARERDILTVGVVTKPFHFEGKYRMEIAGEGIEELKKYVDTLIVIPNQNLFRIANENTTFESAFKMADDVLYAGVRGVTDLITMPGLVNLDFADIRTIMTKMGKAMMGTGEAEGENRAILACEAAISNPLLDDVSIKGAKGVLVNMTGGPDMTLFEADIAVNAIKKEVDQNANIIFGSAFDENMKGKIRISVVATGIDSADFAAKTVVNNYEPTRFKVETPAEKHAEKFEEKNHEVEIVSNYFDPGVAASIEEEIEEVADVNFKPKKSFTKEENLNYGKASHEEFEVKEDVKGVFLQNNFFETSLEKEEREEKIEVKKKPKVAAPKPVKKEKSSGFSLFSFMNGSSKDEDFSADLDEDSDSLLQDFSANEKEAAQPKHKDEAEKKRKQFFAETVLDEDEASTKEVKFDDDILNVPAFFRRKK